jgi:hypothetical protein
VSAAPKLSPVREKPILFSGPMVRAILEGRKTQTRRTVKVVSGRGGVSLVHLPGAPGIYEHLDYDGAGLVHFQPERQAKFCPYGQPGDRLWVRETFGYLVNAGRRTVYRADGDPSDRFSGEAIAGMKWKPSIFMRRSESRITLEVTDVRVERLQDISEEDAKAEGVGFHVGGPVKAFETLWDSINGGRPWRCWDDNPWVWVVGFRRVQP